MVRSGFHAHLDSAPGLFARLSTRSSASENTLFLESIHVVTFQIQHSHHLQHGWLFAFFSGSVDLQHYLFAWSRPLAYADFKMLGLLVFRLMDA